MLAREKKILLSCSLLAIGITGYFVLAHWCDQSTNPFNGSRLRGDGERWCACVGQGRMQSTTNEGCCKEIWPFPNANGTGGYICWADQPANSVDQPAL